MKTGTLRRQFLSAAAGTALWPLAAARGQNDSSAAGEIRLSVATYSLREFQRELAIKMIKQLDISYVDVKEFHLRYRDDPQQLAAGRKEFTDAGLKIMAGGNITMQNDDESDLRRYFEYARICGMPVMVIAPTAATLPKIEKLVKEYGIKVAIHNHGPEDKHFPTPQSVLEVVKNMDSRVGLCVDVGHTARAGADPVKSLADAGARLYEVHLKDLKDFSAHAEQVPVGDGIMPIPAIFRQLRGMKYAGVCSLEYEIHGDDPFPGMQKSFAYMRGVIAGQKSL